MLRLSAIVLATALVLFSGQPAGAAARSDATVATYHGDAARSGDYIVPGLTWQRAATAHLDPAFDGRVDGEINAQPLYWRPQGAAHGLLIVAIERNLVYALDAAGGQPVWRRALGVPVPESSLPCGNMDPVGITGTPVIDPGSATLYVDALVSEQGIPHHQVFALRLADGAVLPGWPVDLDTALHAKGIAFSSRLENQRGALALADGRLYIPFGGNFGDCGNYHGAVAGIDVASAQVVGAWVTRARKGGIWAPGGVVFDGPSLFVATGNTVHARAWGDGEAIIRLPPDLRHSADPRDFFAPANWRELDAEHLEIGGANPIPIDLPAAPRRLLLALGKDGNAYLLDRDDLGGIGGALVVQRVAKDSIITAPAAYPMGPAIYVAFQAQSAICPRGGTTGVAAIRVVAAPRLEVTTAWCARLRGTRPVPIVTSPDGITDPIVWIAGAAGDDRLHGFRGDTGQVVFGGGAKADRMTPLHHFATILPAEGRLYVGGGGRLYSFRFGPP